MCLLILPACNGICEKPWLNNNIPPADTPDENFGSPDGEEISPPVYDSPYGLPPTGQFPEILPNDFG